MSNIYLLYLNVKYLFDSCKKDINVTFLKVINCIWYFIVKIVPIVGKRKIMYTKGRLMRLLQFSILQN